MENDYIDEIDKFTIDIIKKIKKNKTLIKRIKHKEYQPEDHLKEFKGYVGLNIEWKIVNLLNRYNIKIEYKYHIDNDRQDTLILDVKDKTAKIKYKILLKMFIAIFDYEIMNKYDFVEQITKVSFLQFLLKI